MNALLRSYIVFFYPYSKGTLVLALNKSMFIVFEWAKYRYFEQYLKEDIVGISLVRMYKNFTTNYFRDSILS